jgi:hypothetical protein
MGVLETLGAADLLGESAVGRNVIVADSEDLRVELLEAGVFRLKGGQLSSSTAGEVAWVKGDEHLLAAQLAEGYVAVLGRRQGEIWRECAFGCNRW